MEQRLTEMTDEIVACVDCPLATYRKPKVPGWIPEGDTNFQACLGEFPEDLMINRALFVAGNCLHPQDIDIFAVRKQDPNEGGLPLHVEEDGKLGVGVLPPHVPLVVEQVVEHRLARDRDDPGWGEVLRCVAQIYGASP